MEIFSCYNKKKWSNVNCVVNLTFKDHFLFVKTEHALYIYNFLQDYTLWVFYFIKVIFRYLTVSLFTLMKQLKLFFFNVCVSPRHSNFRQYLICWSQTISLLVRTIFSFLKWIVDLFFVFKGSVNHLEKINILFY